MGCQFVPDLGRARTVLEALPESGLGLLQVAVAGVADPEVRVGLPPVGRPCYDLIVGPHGLGVAAQHIQGVGPEGPRAALLHVVCGGLYRLLEELEGFGVVGGVEEGQASVDEHVGVFWHTVRPALEGGLRQRGLPIKAEIRAYSTDGAGESWA